MISAHGLGGKEISKLFSVHLLSWQKNQTLLRFVRTEVFIREQGVTPELEWDGVDEVCQHALALSAAGHTIGCGRITQDGHIGRMAVLANWRGQGVGSSLLGLLLDYARSQNYIRVELNAQIQVVSFYRRFNFTDFGEVFMDANMPHIKMQLHLKNG